MRDLKKDGPDENHWNRRRFLKHCLLAGALAAGDVNFIAGCAKNRYRAETFIGKAESYDADIASIILAGFRELGVSPDEIKGKRILLKPNLVETLPDSVHINTHPLIIHGAAEAFLKLGASEILIGEGPGHRRDTFLVLEESGLDDILSQDKIPFMDLNNDEIYTAPNANRSASSICGAFAFPDTLRRADWIVSMPKLKTHHWVGVTLSMKNMFGVMPGTVYGWPKNAFHLAGIKQSILDINNTLRPHFAIVDGIVGMEGDGPIMGDPRHAGVIVMGRNLPAVDATCARIMGVDPHKIAYIRDAEPWLGPVKEDAIEQRGESIQKVRTPFLLMEYIPSQQGLRLL